MKVHFSKSKSREYALADITSGTIYFPYDSIYPIFMGIEWGKNDYSLDEEQIRILSIVRNHITGEEALFDDDEPILFDDGQLVEFDTDDNWATKKDIIQQLNNYVNKSEIEYLFNGFIITLQSQVTNNSNAIINIQNKFNDYYTKSEIYTKEETYAKDEVYTKEEVYNSTEIDNKLIEVNGKIPENLDDIITKLADNQCYGFKIPYVLNKIFFNYPTTNIYPGVKILSSNPTRVCIPKLRYFSQINQYLITTDNSNSVTNLLNDSTKLSEYINIKNNHYYNFTKQPLNVYVAYTDATDYYNDSYIEVFKVTNTGDLTNSYSEYNNELIEQNSDVNYNGNLGSPIYPTLFISTNGLFNNYNTFTKDRVTHANLLYNFYILLAHKLHTNNIDYNKIKVVIEIPQEDSFDEYLLIDLNEDLNDISTPSQISENKIMPFQNEFYKLRNEFIRFYNDVYPMTFNLISNTITGLYLDSVNVNLNFDAYRTNNECTIKIKKHNIYRTNSNNDIESIVDITDNNSNNHTYTETIDGTEYYKHTFQIIIGGVYHDDIVSNIFEYEIIPSMFLSTIGGYSGIPDLSYLMQSLSVVTPNEYMRYERKIWSNNVPYICVRTNLLEDYDLIVKQKTTENQNIENANIISVSNVTKDITLVDNTVVNYTIFYVPNIDLSLTNKYIYFKFQSK